MIENGKKVEARWVSVHSGWGRLRVDRHRRHHGCSPKHERRESVKAW